MKEDEEEEKRKEKMNKSEENCYWIKRMMVRDLDCTGVVVRSNASMLKEILR